MFVIFMRSYVSQGCETKSSCSKKYVYRVTTSQVNIDLENRQRPRLSKRRWSRSTSFCSICFSISRTSLNSDEGRAAQVKENDL